MPSLQNGARLPVVVAVTCVAGQYSVPGSECLAEYLLLQGQGGAIAVVAPTGLSVNQDASRLNLRLMQLLRANAQAGIGDLFRQALADHVAQDNPATQPAIYNLIGDPATAYNVALASIFDHRGAAIHGGDRQQRRAGDHLVGRQSALPVGEAVRTAARSAVGVSRSPCDRHQRHRAPHRARRVHPRALRQLSAVGLVPE